MAVKSITANWVIIETKHLILRPLKTTDQSAWLTLCNLNKTTLAKWYPSRSYDISSRGFSRLLHIAENGKIEKSAYILGLFFKQSDASSEVLGEVSLHSIVSEKKGNLGFWIDNAHQNRGLMREALSATIKHAFGSLGLHALFADVHPSNIACTRLLQTLKFMPGGETPGDFWFDGRWERFITFKLSPQNCL